MIVTFKTKSSANVILFGDIALLFLEMMGHSKTVPGAFFAEDVPAALDALRKAINELPEFSENEIQRAALDEQNVDETDDAETTELPISLRNRALPLIKLLSDAVDSKSPVSWE